MQAVYEPHLKSNLRIVVSSNLKMIRHILFLKQCKIIIANVIKCNVMYYFKQIFCLNFTILILNLISSCISMAFGLMYVF